MGTRKGLLTKDDADRYTERHNEICQWFLSNANLFVRCFLFDRPVGEIKVTLEQLITSQGDFIIGFADVLLSYSTDEGNNHIVLIEVKGSLRDRAEALRQLNTYQKYLPNVTKKCLVHGDGRFSEWWDEKSFNDEKSVRDLEMRTYFSSQGIYVADYESLKHGFFIPDYCCVFPAGRREIFVDCIFEKNDSIHLQLCGVGFDRFGKDCETAGYLFLNAPFPPDLWKLLGMRSPDTCYKVVRKSPCLVNVQHRAGSCGFAEEKYNAIHNRDMTVSIELK